MARDVRPDAGVLPHGEARDLVTWLTDRGAAPEVYEGLRTTLHHGPPGDPPLREPRPVRVVRVVLPELRELGLVSDELWWTVSEDGSQVTVHPDLRANHEHWVDRALRLRHLRGEQGDTPGLAEQVRAERPSAGPEPTQPPAPPRVLGAPPAPRGRDRGRGRVVALVTVWSAGIVVLLLLFGQVLQEWRDFRARGLAEDGATSYAAALVDGGPEERVLQTVAQRYFKGEVVVAWTVRGAGSDAKEFATCVEMRSPSGEEAYAAAWATSDRADDPVTRSARGAGCGPEPRDLTTALRTATTAD